MSSMLRTEGLHAGYDDLPVLLGVDIDVSEGEIVAVVGANGAGKSTLLKTLSGSIKPTAGRITFDGDDITGMRVDKVPALGLVLVPEGRHLFPYMTVEENLKLGAYHSEARKRMDEGLDEMYKLFPILRKRTGQLAGSLSGGEQQMCALARGLMARPKLIMFDEPSLGLAPIIVDRLFSLIGDLAARGLTILLVEQNVSEALQLASRAYVIERGEIAMKGAASDLLRDDGIRAAYLGAG